MSTNPPSALKFEKSVDNSWSVQIGDGNVAVHSFEDARLIASLPVELAKFRWDSSQKPNIAAAHQVVDACKKYNLYKKVFQVRELDALLSKASNHETVAEQTK